MACVCCRCGALQDSAAATLCLKVAGTQQSYHCHCFCCAQSPRMKCFYCNTWRDLDVLEAHGPCATGLKHLFVYSEPWPPFSDRIPNSPQQAMVITVGRHQEVEEQIEVENPSMDQDIKNVNPDINSEQQISDEDQEVFELEEFEDAAEPVDVKPNLSNKSNCKWVSIGDIRKWTSCIRCGMVRIKKEGWIRHAQKCGQNPNYSSRKFFIYLHTISWCGTLVMDTFWESHSDPEKGSCNLCRVSRKNKIPLPFQPEPPARKKSLQKQHQSRLKMKRKKRRQTLAMDAQIRNANANNNLQIVGCTSLRP